MSHRVFIGLIPAGYLDPIAIRQTLKEGVAFCNKLNSFNKKTVILVDNPTSSRDRTIFSESISAIQSTQPETHQLYILTKTRAELSELKKLAYPAGDTPSKIKLESIQEGLCTEYLLSKGSLSSCSNAATLETRTTNKIVSSRHFADAQAVVYFNKLRGLPSRLGFSGAIRTGKEGLIQPTTQNIDPNYDRSLVDFLEVSNPQIIISDAITVPYGGSESGQPQHELGLILISNNAVAHDMVISSLFHVDLNDNDLLKTAIKRGWGPTNLQGIQWGGAGLEGLGLLKEKTKAWRRAPSKLQEFPEFFQRETNGESFPWELTPSSDSSDSMLLQWLLSHFDELRLRTSMKNWPAFSVVLSKDFSKPKHSIVIIIGKGPCAQWRNKYPQFKTWLTWKQQTIGMVSYGRKENAIVLLFDSQAPQLSWLDWMIATATLGKIRPFQWTLKSKCFTPPARKAKPDIVAAIKTADLPSNQWWSKLPYSQPIS